MQALHISQTLTRGTKNDWMVLWSKKGFTHPVHYKDTFVSHFGKKKPATK